MLYGTMNKNWLQADWPAPTNIRAGTTLRSGGIRSGAYHSLNLAAHVGDRLQHVTLNRQYLARFLNLPATPAWLEQVHGNRVLQAGHWPEPRQADASYTNACATVCAVLTADCLPILICAADGSYIAAIHAGWRGLLDGIVENTLRVLPKDDLLVWLGPAIGACCFAVGSEVYQAYVGKSLEFACAFQPIDTGKWRADIYQLARITLNQASVTKIYGGNFCTCCDEQRFYSYRRDQTSGRMASLIWKL